MAANPVLVGGALLAGGAALWALYKAWQAKQASTTDNFCNGLCNGLTGAELAACQATCQLGSTIIGAIPDPFTDSEGAWKNQISSDAKNNDELNGPIALHVAIPDLGGPTPDSALTGNALLYQNGCSPFFDAPGWTKCKAGTLDMYASAVRARAGGGDYSNDASGEAALVTNAGTVQPDPRGYTGDGNVETVHINKNNFLTGLPGDPTTKGPFGAKGSGLEMYIVQTSDSSTDPLPASVHNLLYQYSGDVCSTLPDGTKNCPDETEVGPLTWYARGTRITCPAGQVPKSVLQGANGIANTDPVGTEVCVSAIGGADLCNGTQPPPGFTWDITNGVWIRATPGQPVNAGPCDPNFGKCIGASCVQQTKVGTGVNEQGGASTGTSSTRSTSTAGTSSSSTINLNLDNHGFAGGLGGFL